MTKCFKWTLKIYWRVKTIWLVLYFMPGEASQDMLLDDLFEDIYQIVMYLLWSQSVFNSNDECFVVYIVITALCNTLLSFQLLSFLWKTELPVSCQPHKPNFYPQCVPSDIKLYLSWRGWRGVVQMLGALEGGFCSASPVVSVPSSVRGSSLALVSIEPLQALTTSSSVLGLAAVLTSVSVGISGHWIEKHTSFIGEWSWWHAIFPSSPLALCGTQVAWMFWHFLQPGMGLVQFLIRSPVLDQLKHKSRLQLEGAEPRLRLSISGRQSTGCFPLHKEVGDFTAALECSLLGREVGTPTSVFSLSFQESFLLCPLKFTSPKLLDYLLWRGEEGEIKSKREDSCLLPPCTKAPNRIQACV